MEFSIAEGLAQVDLRELGSRVRTLRQERKLTQSDVAGDDLSAAYVSRIEAGQRRPELRVVELLAKRLGTSAQLLVSGVGPEEAEEHRLTLRYAELAVRSGEHVDAEQQLRRLLETPAERLGRAAADAQWLLGSALEGLGRLDDAIEFLEQARDELDGVRELECVIALCRCYRESGDLARSIDVGEAGVKRANELGLLASDEAVRLAVTVVAAYFERGDVAYATVLCRRALAQAEAGGSSTARAAAYWNSSLLALERNDIPTAIILAERALALLGEGEDIRSMARARSSLGLLLLEADPPDLAEAERLLAQAAEDLAAGSGSPVDIARCRTGLARVHLATGRLDEAARLATSARDACVDAGPLAAANAELILGRVAAANGDLGGARASFVAASHLLTRAGSGRGAAQIWSELGALLDAAGDAEGARDAYRSAAASMGLQPRPASVIFV